MKKVYILWSFDEIFKVCDSLETAKKAKENYELIDKCSDLWIEEVDVLDLNNADHYSNYLSNKNEINFFEIYNDLSLYKLDDNERLGLHLNIEESGYDFYKYKITFRTDETDIKKIHKIGKGLLNEVNIYLYENGVDLDVIKRATYAQLYKHQVKILMENFKGSFYERSYKND